jgi:quinol monooxygenase YgiN
MIHAIIRMTIPPQEMAQVLEILRPVVELSRDDLGCLWSHVYRDVQEENVFMLEEVWNTEDALEHHIRSKEYYNMLLVLELALKRPEIRFDTISSSAGIETIEKARGVAG